MIKEVCMKSAVLACCLTLAFMEAALGDELTVSLPRGETLLGDVGTYRVTYQSYGREPVEMPVSWMGHFTEDSGIAYLPQERLMGRSAILLHSPWRVPPGKAWVDYRLQLPDAVPITLSFGIAMGPDAGVPGKSDGVTFSCYVIVAGRQEELMRQHHDRVEWRDFEFDLSRFAGREVTLRLQTEPGPRNDPGWDYSYFGDARIAAGGARESRAELVGRLRSAPAYRAAEKADLRRLSNDPGGGVTPSNLFACKNSISRAGTAFRFAYEGEDCQLAYVYEPATGTLDDFAVQVDDGRPFRPAMGGGVVAAHTEAGATRHVPVRGGRLDQIALADDGRALNVLWDYEAAGTALRIAWTFGIVGKALVVSARCEQPVISSFSLGEVGFAPFRKPFEVPYLPGHVSYLPEQNLSVCRYLDWTASHASQCPQGTAAYELKTDGTRNLLFEKGYVAVSPNVGEVLPNIPHPASPYLGRLAPLVMLDMWGWGAGGSFKADAENLRRLKDNGVDHLAIIQHVWQRYGYDVKLPDHLPPNPDFGGDEGMAEFGRAANDCGYLWCLHENYIDLYPDAPSYDRTAVVLRADGSPSPAWFNAGTGVQSFGLKCNRALDCARQNSPEIHRRYKTTAAYLDVHTCVPPWHQLDHDATQPMAAMALAKVKWDADLFQFMRDTHGGPLFGEGGNHFYWAGRCDGVEAQVNGGEHVVPLIDFDLLKIHPQMVNHGMGYYERWFERGYGARWGVDAGTVEQVDKYRAQEVAFSHAGFVGAAQVENVQWVAKEHHMMHPIQRLYGGAKATEVLYEVEGQLVPASIALAAGDLSRQHVRYDSGLAVWVNWCQDPWQVEGRVLPQWGFLALGPGTEVCAELRDGRFADYAECPEYIFADARTSFDMPYLKWDTDIEPRLRDFQYVGGNRIRLAYEWLVNQPVEQDLYCFVHFTNEGSERPEQIEFQQDHLPSRATSQWRRGDVVVDGPYEMEVPEGKFGTYDVLIGLYKESRLRLKGARTSEDRILIGRLKIERRNGRVSRIALEDIGEAQRKLTVPRADFAARLSPAGTSIDFGKVATDGCVKVNRDERSLTVFPYPRDKSFRVEIDVKALCPGADPERLQVRALAAGTCEDMGPVPFAIDRGRLALSVGTKGAGRYLVTW